MARAMWKGSIAFGLVNIPIELYSPVRDHRPKFRLLHAKDQAPVRYERVCQTEGKPIGWEEIVEAHQGADVVDLMTRLRASLEGKAEPAAKVKGTRTAAPAARGKKKGTARRRTGHAA